MAPPLDDDLRLAMELADAADAITMQAFRRADLRIDTKPDMTPVTEADRGVEEMLRARIAAVRAADAVVGEEFGASGESPRCWYLDPIDGTGNFVRGMPVFATLIALQVDGGSAVGVCSAPALRMRWWAARGGGAFADGRRIAVSRIARVEDAH